MIDGYIEGAQVCLDLNNNQACDSNEPSATTAADGSYKLDISGVSASALKTAHLFTVVPETAYDKDDEVNGVKKSLKDAGKKAFNLLAPAAALTAGSDGSISGAVVSPLTTLVSHEMIASNAPLATSQKNVRERLALATDTDLSQDFVAKKDTMLMAKAQMLTVVIGEVKAQALADTTSKPTEKQALFAALQYLQTQVAALTRAFEDARASDANAKPVALVKKAFESEAAKPAVATLLAESKKITESSALTAAQIEAIVNEGFYSGEYLLSCGTLTSCTPRYWKIVGKDGKVTRDDDYVLDNGAWKLKSTSTSTSSSNEWVLNTAGQWVAESSANMSYKLENDVITVTRASGRTERVNFRKVDAAGKTLTQLGLNPPAAFENTVMPSGSLVYWSEFSPTTDLYRIYNAVSITTFDSTVNPPATTTINFANLNDFINAYTTGSPKYQNPHTGYSGLCWSFDSEGRTATGGTVSAQYCSTRTSIGKASYKITNVRGESVLIVNAQPPNSAPGELPMFAVKNDKVYYGSFTPASATAHRSATKNKIMLNAVLNAAKKPEVVN